MNPIYVQLLISVLTLLFGGLISSVVTHRLTTSRAEREFRRQRIEQLYKDVQEYIGRLNRTHLVTVQLMLGLISMEGANTVLVESAERDKAFVSSEDIEMTLNIYFRHLLPVYEELSISITEWSMVRERFIFHEGRTDGKAYPDFLKEHGAAFFEVRECKKNFNQMLFAEAKII